MRRRHFLHTVLIGSGLGAGLASRPLFAAGGQAAGSQPAGAPPRTARNGSRGPIIDVHMHAYPADEAIPADATNPATGRPPGVKDGAAHMQACLAEMKRLNIVTGVVSGGSGDRLGAALQWHDAAPDRIIAGAGVRGSEDTPLPPLDVLRKAFAEKRLRVLGELTAQYAGLKLDDRKYQEYLALAEEFDIPVAVHTGLGGPGISYDPCCRGFRASLGNPALLEEALNQHPKLRMNVMHGGWPYVQETIALLLSYPKVYTDIGAINWILPRAEFHAYLSTMMRAGLGKRVLFGSDQMYWPEAIGMAVDAVDAATFLSPSAKRDIFHDNAMRFLNMTPS
jgi:uncharacterized protein